MDSPPALDALTARLERADRVALDTEADSLHSYYEKVCLLQMSFGGEDYIVDPLVGLDLSAFLRVLAGGTLLLHGADFDLRMLRASFGFRPHGEVHDTQLAAQLVGIQEVGLVALVQRFCGAAITKAGQKTNWARRPLTPAQLAYAVDDTRHLEALADALFQELHRIGRYACYRESCERLVKATARDRERDPADAWRIKGLRGLDRRQLAFVRELWLWREHEAQKADVPPFMVLGNAQLRDLAIWATAHPRRPLAHGPKLPRNCTGRRLRALGNAIERAHELPKPQWPHDREHPGPRRATTEEDRQVNALMAECARIAGDLSIAPPLLAPRAALEAIVARKPNSIREILACSPLMRWQAELVAPAILRALAATPTKE